MKGGGISYFRNIKAAILTSLGGLKLTLRHLWQAREQRKPVGIENSAYFEQKTGLVTLKYPYESLPVPDNGRYRLHNEIDDCIVCDKCAKICPVDCIEIEPVRAVEPIGTTSDGTSKRIYAAKFDIDMAKCCFCGLCTTVCPTECLTMTKAYDFSEYDVKDHNYSFAEMTPLEILEKKKALEEFNARKAAQKKTTENTSTSVRAKTTPDQPLQQKDAAAIATKPKFKPRVGMKPKTEGKSSEETVGANSSSVPKPKFRPKIKPKATTNTSSEQDKNPQLEQSDTDVSDQASSVSKASTKDNDLSADVNDETSSAKLKPKFKPRPVIKKKKDE